MTNPSPDTRTNLRRALETIRDLPEAEIENGPEIADTALDAIDHLNGLATSSDTSAAEVVALLRAGVGSLQTWPYDAVPTEATISSLCKLLTISADTLDASSAETAAANAERDEALALLKKVSLGLESLTPGGSEFISHSKLLDTYFADVQSCTAVVRERFNSGHTAKIEAVDNKRLAAAANARTEALERAAYSPGPAVEALIARAETAESKLAKAVEAKRKADGELWMLEGACAGILADAEELERWWPKSKRGSNAKRAFESIMSRRDAVVACARDARAALTEIEGGKSK